MAGGENSWQSAGSQLAGNPIAAIKSEDLTHVMSSNPQILKSSHPQLIIRVLSLNFQIFKFSNHSKLPIHSCRQIARAIQQAGADRVLFV